MRIFGALLLNRGTSRGHLCEVRESSKSTEASPHLGVSFWRVSVAKEVLASVDGDWVQGAVVRLFDKPLKEEDVAHVQCGRYGWIVEGHLMSQCAPSPRMTEESL